MAVCMEQAHPAITAPADREQKSSGSFRRCAHSAVPSFQTHSITDLPISMACHLTQMLLLFLPGRRDQFSNIYRSSQIHLTHEAKADLCQSLPPSQVKIIIQKGVGVIWTGQFHVGFHLKKSMILKEYWQHYFLYYRTVNCNALQPSFSREVSQSYYKQEH